MSGRVREIGPIEIQLVERTCWMKVHIVAKTKVI